MPLTRGLFAIADAADAEFLRGFKWRAHAKPKAYAATGKRTALMHRLLWSHWGLPGTREIDHANCNTLDNRRENLRPASHADNMHNMPRNRLNTTGFKGVSFKKDKGKYFARIKVNGKKIHLGYFAAAEDAHAAYVAAAHKHFGDFARAS